MKIGIFGCGYIYNKYKHLLPDDLQIVAFLDNDVANHDSLVDGFSRIYPREIFEYEVDLIILMSNAAVEMREQLCSLGFDMSKVVHYKDFFGGLKQKRETFFANGEQKRSNKSLLIVSNELGFHGAPVVVLGMVQCAGKMGYHVTVAASEGDRTFISELNSAGADVVIQEWIEHASWDNLKWTNEYDRIIVNTLPVINCALTIASHRKVYLWLHENPDTYYFMKYWHGSIKKRLMECDLSVFVVSKRADENFRRFIDYDRPTSVLTPYIQDWCMSEGYIKTSEVIFAVVGPFVERKGQHILLNAIHSLKSQSDARFLFVGKSGQSSYATDIFNQISKDKCCEYLGEMVRRDIGDFYRTIDVVVVPSMEETLSLVAVEAMMMGKVCIVSDHCGVSDYITNGENGFVFSLQDTDALAECIEWCIDHKEECAVIGANARRTYEKHFSINAFERSLESILD